VSRISYRYLNHYKYQLLEDYVIQTEIRVPTNVEIPDFILLTINGKLIIRKYYAWDGPSGPTIDTKNFMRGSLVHDALYQLIRERKLTPPHRKDADELLRTICLEDDMTPFRAWYVYHGVRLFGKYAAKPGSDSQKELIFAP
jgi:hypothetical protein